MAIDGSANWSSFLWSNASVVPGTDVSWVIHANDSTGNLNSTDAMSFNVIEAPPGDGEPSGPGVYTAIGPGPGAPSKSFTTDRSFVRLIMARGTSAFENITIENNGSIWLNFSFSVQGIGGFVTLDESGFVLEAGRARSLGLMFSVPSEMNPDVYPGMLLIEADGLNTSIPLILEVRDISQLMELFVSLADVPLMAKPGDEVMADIMIYNLVDSAETELRLYYSIRDFDGNDIVYRFDSIMVKEQRKISRMLKTLDDMEMGYYLFYVQLYYGNSTYSSSGLINVFSEGIAEQPEIPWLLILMVAAVAAVILVFAYLTPRRWLKKAKKRRIDETHLPSYAYEKHVKELQKDLESIRSEFPKYVRKDDLKRMALRPAPPKVRKDDVTMLDDVHVFVGRKVTVEGDVRLLKSVEEKGMKLYWYKVKDRTGEAIMVVHEKIDGSKAKVRGTVRETKSGSLYIEVDALL
jgi:hypothetical protein